MKAILRTPCRTRSTTRMLSSPNVNTITRSEAKIENTPTTNSRNISRKLFSTTQNNEENQATKQDLFRWLSEIQESNVRRFEQKYGFSLTEEKPINASNMRFVWSPVEKADKH